MSNNGPGETRPTFKEQEQYWQQRLTDLPLLELPLDNPRSGFRSFIRERQSIVFDDGMSNGIRKFCETEDLTVFTVLCAAHIAVLGRQTGQTDIILGTISPDCIDSKGEVFANPLTLRVDIGDNPIGHQFLRRVAETIILAADNRDCRFQEMESILGDNQNFDRMPLFQIAFALCGEENSGPWGKSLSQNDLDMVAEYTARCDVLLVASEHNGNWSIEADFDTDVLEADTVTRFLGHIKILISALINEPDQVLSDFPLISEEERQQLLVEWNATSVDYPDHLTLHELLEAQVERTPESPALFYEDEVLTYRELNCRANILARHLQKLGIGPEVFVGVYMERSVEMVVALYAILKAGGAYVPLDPEYPPDRVGFMLDDAQVPVLLTQEHLRERCPGSQARILCVDIDQAVGDFDSAQNLDGGAKADNLAYVIFTSGSTGRPKGVMVEHRAICNRLLWMQDTYQIGNSDRIMQKTPFSFDVSVWEFFWPLQVGAALVIAQPGAHRDNAYMIKLIIEQAITTLHFVPSMLRLFVEESGLSECTSLKRIICSGEALPVELQALFFERVGAELHNLYGPTEAAVDVTYWPCSQDSELHVVPIGRPVANTQIYVLDHNLRPVPIRAPGELYIGGVQLARGYLNQPELTNEKFIPNPFRSEPGARLYKTGDLGCVLPDGIFEYLGRIDHQVKLRGFRIELGEIEAQLCEHPNVSESVVMLREDNPEDKRLVGYIVPKGKEVADFSELQNFLKKKLPDFMIPDQIISLDAIPLSPSGKADRKALPAPGIQKRGGLGNNDISPQSDLEQIVKAVWSEVLKHEDVGTRENFFDLGGHSLLVAACRIKLQEKLGLELSMTELFRYPTVESLARHISGQLSDKVAINTSINTQKRKISNENPDIAIIGMACRLPGAEDVGEFWQNLKEGVESVTFFTDEELRTAGVDPAKITNSSYIKARAILAGADEFDAAFFGYSPREAELMDPQQRVFLECAWHAMENSGYDPGSFQDPIGVFAGEGMNTYLLNNLYEEDSDSGSVGAFQVMIGNDKDFLATRVSYKLDLKGPAINVQTACSTSLVATHLACQSLVSGECEMVLAGGSSIHFPQISGYEYQEGMILSSDGHCRAFDSKADGTVFGNGVAAVVLKCLDTAIADGDHIYAVIKGSAINNDGAVKIGYTAPSVDGQAAVISRAHMEARVDPGSITYVETHGTGTALGDPIEIEALSQAFSSSNIKKTSCGIGTVKTNIGHVDAAAGVSGLIKTALALKHRVLPPSLHFREANSQINFSESPFYVVTKPTEWSSNGQPRRAGVSSFGIGGTNAHVILEEAPERKRDELNLERSSQMLCLSAKSESALKALAGRYDAYFKTHPESVLGDVCFTANAGRAHFGHRLVVVGDTVETLRTGLEDYVIRGTGTSVQQNEAKLGESLKVAFLFTGQGSQWVGMGRELYETQASFRRDMEHCEEVLREYMDRPLLEVMFGNKEDEGNKLLDETAYTQPALFALEYSLAQLWRSWGIEPAILMGHSVGEYVAACLAGVFTLEDGLKLVAERGRLMQSLPHEGEMVAVRGEERRVSEIIAPYTSEVSLAAVNGPTSVVISGQREAMREIVEKLNTAGMEVRPLQVSHAFHSPLMEPMLKAFEEVASTVHYSPPRIAMVSNVTGKMTGEEVTRSQYWVDHVRQTVQFASGMETLHANSFKIYLEVGPQPTLLGMGRQCVPEKSGEWLPSLRKGRTDWNQMLTTLGALYVRGASIDWPGFERDYRHYRLPLPTYPFQRQRYWVEPKAFSRHTKGESLRGLHPLLGHRLRLPQSSEIRFETNFSRQAPAYVEDHRVFGVLVVAGASHVSMFLQAVEEAIGGNACQLEEIFFLHPFVLSEDDGKTAQLVFKQVDSAEREFELMSLKGNARENESSSWVVHVAGKLKSESRVKGSLGLNAFNAEAVQQRCIETISGNDFYQSFWVQGSDAGPSFRWLKQIWKGEGEALGLTECPALNEDAGCYQLHPGVIEACFQILRCCREFESQQLLAKGGHIYVPFSIEQVRFYGRPENDSLWCYARIRGSDSASDRVVIGDLHLQDLSGNVVAEIIGFEVRKLPKEQLLRNLKNIEGNINDWLYEMVWKPSNRSPDNIDNPNTECGVWLLLAEPQGTGLELATLIRERGDRCVLASPGTQYSLEESGCIRLAPDDPQQFDQLIRDVFKHAHPVISTTESSELKGVIYAWSLENINVSELSLSNLESSQCLGCEGMLYLVQALTRFNEQTRLWSLTRGGQSIVDEKTSLQIHQAPLTGLARVIAQEHPELRCTSLDLDLNNNLGECRLVIDELWSTDSQEEIAYRGEKRYINRLERHKTVQTETFLGVQIHESAGYLVTGGLGGLGIRIAQWLAARGAKHIALLGRREPNEQAHDALEALRKTGVNILVLQGDVSDSTSLSQVFDKMESSMPPLQGIVHTAGVIDDGVLLQQTTERFRTVMAPKVSGAWNLHLATQQIPLDFFILFSSATSLMGTAGQGNYAAANAFLDLLAHYRKAQGLTATSINWGPWAEIGMAARMTEQDKRRSQEQGWDSISPELGVEVLDLVLAEDIPQLAVLPVNWSKFAENRPAGGIPSMMTSLVQVSENRKQYTETGLGQKSWKEQLQEAKEGERIDVLSKYIKTELASLLGLGDSIDSLNPMQGFTEMGMDSLMGVELRSRLQSNLGVKLSATFAFDYSNIHDVSNYLSERLFGETLSTDDVKPASDTLADSKELDIDVEVDSEILDPSIEEELAQIEKHLKQDN